MKELRIQELRRTTPAQPPLEQRGGVQAGDMSHPIAKLIVNTTVFALRESGYRLKTPVITRKVNKVNVRDSIRKP